MKPLTEYEEAKNFTNWANDVPGIMLFHIPNENPIKNPAYYAKMKAQGWRAGISDYFCIIYPTHSINRKMCGLWIELKRVGGISDKTGKQLASPSKVFPEQAAFISDVKMIDGVEGKICYGCNESIEFVMRYLK